MKWFTIICLMLFSAGHGNFKVVYQVDRSSKLFLNGSTSVNTFQCYCTDEFPASSFTGTADAGGNIQFSNAKLLIKTKLLSCKNNLMNRDMHKALKSDNHPYIQVQLLSAVPVTKLDKSPGNTWLKYSASTTLTIAGVSKPVTIEVFLNRVSPHLYRLLASRELLMSDYEVKPRTPMNIIKINDRVTINFDMTVIVNAE